MDPGVFIDSVVLINTVDLALITEYDPVETVTVTADGGATSVHAGGTLQMSAEVLPATATLADAGVRWSVVSNGGWAHIDETGLLTGDTAGNIKVVAAAKDDSGVTGELSLHVDFPEGIAQETVNTLRVYPNPAVNELNVVLTELNCTVSIYNSVGQKVDEALVNGYEHRFDISSYAAGLYFVKSGDLVTKFIK
jgi:hypothetical protein